VIAEIIRTARVGHGLTQADLAERAGVSVQAIKDLERGSGRLPILAAVLTILDVRLAGLPKGTDLAARLKTARTRKGWSQDRLADAAGVSPGAIARLEAGTARIGTAEAVIRFLAPDLRARRPDVAPWEQGARDSRFTPAPLLDVLTGVFGPLALDPCADPGSPVRADRYIYESDDGLVQPWTCDGPVFVNPPYSHGAAFARRGFEEWRRGACPIVILLLRSRTDGSLFHDCLVEFGDVFLLRDRIRFVGADGELRGDRAPFGNIIATLGASDAQARQLAASIECVHIPPRQRSAQVRRLAINSTATRSGGGASTRRR